MITDDAVVVLDLMPTDGGCEKDDGRTLEFRVFVNQRGDISAGQTGHDDVQQDEIGLKLTGRRDRILRPVLGPHLVVAGVLQVQFEQRGQTLFVVHQQDAFFSHVVYSFTGFNRTVARTPVPSTLFLMSIIPP